MVRVAGAPLEESERLRGGPSWPSARSEVAPSPGGGGQRLLENDAHGAAQGGLPPCRARPGPERPLDVVEERI
eukprot:7925922-Lingulodinium_polyedra.AAC.1